MFRVAVVEGDAACAARLQDHVRTFARERKMDVQIVVFPDAGDFAETYQPEYDLVLMNVETPFKDGMSAAKTIRQKDRTVILILIANSPGYALQGYEVEAFDYLLNPVSFQALSASLCRAAVRIRADAGRFLLIRSRSGLRRIPAAEITYVESQGHRQIIHTENSEHETLATMKELEECLSPLHFVRCNNGYLVNLARVNAVQDSTVYLGRETVTVSRPRRREFLQTLTDYLMEAS